MKKSPDIALFTRWISGGGAERVMSNLANAFAERGLSVDLVIIQDRKEATSSFHSNVRVIDLEIQTNSGLRFIPSSLQSVQSLPKLVSYLREYRPPVLMSATHYVNEIALLAKKFALVSTRVIVTEHTFLSQETQLVEQLSSRMVPFTVRALYSFADDIVAVSHGVAKDLANFMLVQRKPIQVIYNSVVTPEIYELAQQKIEHPWFLNKDQPIVIGSGRFVKQKDFSSLLRAFSKLRKTRPVRLVLLGDGRERKALEELAIALNIKEDLWMPGFVDNPYAFVAKADLFVLSSAWEGLPTALIEALALKTPIVSTDCPSGPSEILRNGEYGNLVPVGDVEAMMAAMETALANEPRTAPESWVRQFTPEVVIEKYMKIAKIPALQTGTSEHSLPCEPHPTLGKSATPKSQPANRTSDLVSIIIPAYHADDLISDALDSVQQQTYQNWEVIVVEDGTKDETESITQRFAEGVGKHKVRYIRHAVNQGLSAARNTGIAAAKGEYIALLDHDDIWKPQHLEKLVAKLVDDSADLVFGAAEFFHYSTHTALGFHGPQNSEWLSFPESLLNRNYIPASGIVMRAEVPEQVGEFDCNLKRVEDLDYWLRCTDAGMKFSYVAEMTNGYRQRNPKAMTSNKADILEWHARVLRKNSRLKSVSQSAKGRTLARYHLGVSRRSLKSQPLKAWDFAYWSVRRSPVGTAAALKWFLVEKLGYESRYTQDKIDATGKYT